VDPKDPVLWGHAAACDWLARNDIKDPEAVLPGAGMTVRRCRLTL